MKAIAFIVLVCTFAAVAARVAVADAAPTQYRNVSTAEIRRDLALRLPPLVLPDIRGRAWKLSRADRQWLAPQLKKSTQVVAFFENPENRWVLAPRQDKCWNVPWQRQCTLARAKLRLHHKLAEVAEHRLTYEWPTVNDWMTSIRLVQKAFPGTSHWLSSCSRAEGGHGKFVVYGGGSYYAGAEYDQTFHGDMVGGNMQYMWGTFKGHYRHGMDALKKQGFEVKLPPVQDVRAWLSPMAQAIAAGWARWSGNDNSHWSASFGNGCS